MEVDRFLLWDVFVAFLAPIRLKIVRSFWLGLFWSFAMETCVSKYFYVYYLLRFLFRFIFRLFSMQFRSRQCTWCIKVQENIHAHVVIVGHRTLASCSELTVYINMSFPLLRVERPTERTNRAKPFLRGDYFVSFSFYACCSFFLFLSCIFIWNVFALIFK